MSMPPIAYIAYTALGAVAAPLVHALVARKLPGNAARQRAGHANQPRPSGGLIWLHAVSLGEARSILPLAHALAQTHRVLITTVTATGAQLVMDDAPDCLHQFAPIDTPKAVRRFLDHWRPDLMVLTESELWPQQIIQTARRGIPVVLVNARLSRGSRQRWRRWPRLARFVLSHLTAVRAQDTETARSLSELGAPNVRQSDNLKSMAPALRVDEVEAEMFRTALAGRPVWVAASTHDGEEAIVLRAHQALLAPSPDAILILAPRHPPRFDAVAKLVQQSGLSLVRRSDRTVPGPDTQVFLADTMGEMGLWYHLSPVAFLGGSMVDRGGHNPIEAAQLRTRIITGPFIANTVGLLDSLPTDQVTQIRTGADLAQAVAHAITAPTPPPLQVTTSWAELAAELTALANDHRSR